MCEILFVILSHKFSDKTQIWQNYDNENDDDDDDVDDDLEEMLHCLHVSRHRGGLAVLMQPRLPQSSISSSSLSLGPGRPRS